MGSSDVSLAEQIRRRVDAGEVPCERPPKLWVGFGSGETCSGCDQEIHSAQVMYELDLDDKTYRLHTGCYGLWNGALIRPTSPHDRPTSPHAGVAMRRATGH
jgi:hypothetical protein